MVCKPWRPSAVKPAYQATLPTTELMWVRAGAHRLAGGPVEEEGLWGVADGCCEGSAPRLHRRIVDRPWQVHAAAAQNRRASETAAAARRMRTSSEVGCVEAQLEAAMKSGWWLRPEEPLEGP